MIGTRIYSEHKHSHSWENLSIAIYQFVLKLFETHIIRFSFQIAVGHPSKWKEKKQKTILIRSKRICTSQSDLCKFFNKSFSIFATLSSFFDSIIYPIWLANKYSMWNLFGYVENELENFSNNFTSETTNFSSFHEYTKFPYQLPNNSSLWGHQESVYFIILAF